MEEENNISFWKKIKISVWRLEDYQNIALQKTGKTIGYLAKLMLIFAFFLSIVLTYKFGKTVNNVKQYVENEISEIHFENSNLTVKSKQNVQEPIVIEDEKVLNGKVIIDTNELTEEQKNKHTDSIKGYNNGIIILKDRIILKTEMSVASTTIHYREIAEKYNIVKLDKQDVTEMLSESNLWILYIAFFVTMYIYLFIIYFSTVLINAILYSLLAYITGVFSRLRLKYSACYNIAAHSLTLPIILNLIYMIVNLFTGYTIKYFNIMYMAITCVYIVTVILMIKSDVIKKQIELSRIISEQEKVKQELERQEQERKEEEEKERIRKEDEKKRQEEKGEKKSKDKLKSNKERKENNKREPSENETPQPEANIEEV